MSEPVNLDNLHEMTGGDKDLEQELFQVFISSSDKCLSELKTNTATGQEEEWRVQAHAWKGMSLNLGAEALGNLCATAQTEYLIAEDKKLQMLAQIEEEYTRVKEFLTSC